MRTAPRHAGSAVQRQRLTLFSGYQDPVSLAVLGGDDVADDIGAPHASPPHPILLPHEKPGAPPIPGGIPPDLLSSENEPESSEQDERPPAGKPAGRLAVVQDSSDASSDGS